MENNNLSKIIDLAIDDNVEGLSSAVHDELLDRVQDIIAAKRMEVAQKFFNSEE